MKEVEAERWTSSIDRFEISPHEGGSVVALSPGGANKDPALRWLMVGRAAKLERLGLAEQVGPAQWTLKLGIEPAQRDLGIRGDIVKIMHDPMTDLGRKPDAAGFALH